MKTIVIGIALTLICFTAMAQEQKTIFHTVSVVTTSTGTSAQLAWKKGTENISYFIVEKSADGIDYKQCGIVFLSDDPQFTEYKFRDKITAGAKGFLYRIGIISDQNRVQYLPAKTLVAPEIL